MNTTEWFNAVRKSRLIAPAALTAWRYQNKGCTHAHTIAKRMVIDGLLTVWQAEQLLGGRWQGFFVDQYCITDNLGVDHARGLLLLEALDIQNGRTLVLEVVPPARERNKDGSLKYSIRHLGAMTC
jgi:hypothetical protein